MAELRRLMIETARLNTEVGLDGLLTLNPKESHYLKNVLRLRCGDSISIVDGIGHLWEAKLQGGNSIKLSSSLDAPLEEQKRPKPLIGLAVVPPKKGFDELLRMSCEIGVDIIQPLTSQRGVVRTDGEKRSMRWEAIIREAVEQSERLWQPELRSIIDFKVLANDVHSEAVLALASTRLVKANDFQLWMMELKHQIDEIWVAIGPEGGWTNAEIHLANESGFISVGMGESIMRTSTAAVAATELMVAWRRNSTHFLW